MLTKWFEYFGPKREWRNGEREVLAFFLLKDGRVQESGPVESWN